MGKTKNVKRIKKSNQEILTKKEWLSKFFGKVKGYGDGVEYQRKLRDE